MIASFEHQLSVAQAFATLGNSGNGLALGNYFSDTGLLYPPGGAESIQGPKAIGEFLQNLLDNEETRTAAEVGLLDDEPTCLIWKKSSIPVRVCADRFTEWDDDGKITELRVETDREVLDGVQLLRDKSSFDPVAFDSKHCIREVANAYSQEGGLTILYGNLAPEGSVVKTAGVGPKMLKHEGPAVIFESQEEACDGILGKLPDKKVKAGDVVVIRYEGPRGGPGMQEMLAPTSYIKGVGLGDSVALITDGRFSGGTAGACIGHISPEAAEAGPIGLIQDGDTISIDIPAGKLNVKLSDEDLEARKSEWTPPPPRLNYGILGRYQKMVTNAATGAILKLD